MEDFLRDIFKHVEGYYYGLVDITPKILLAILVVLISWLIASRVKVFANKRLQTKMHDPLLATFIANLIKAVLIVIGLLFMFRVIGFNGSCTKCFSGCGNFGFCNWFCT